MCRIKVAVSSELVFFSIFLVASMAFTPPLHAQAVAGATIAVRMIDAVNSTSDPAGKQYRASITKTVDAANGVVIAKGSAAVVTVAKSGPGWSAQLSSVSINGQPVAVASGRANVTSATQSAVGSVTNAMNSVLGGFGHHVKIPAGVAAVATGQRVILPPGTTLTFMLSQPPAAAGAPSMTASAAPAPSLAANPAPGPAAAAGGNYAYCFAGSGQTVTYFSEVFMTPALQGNPPPHMAVVTQQRALNRSWISFLQKKHAPSELQFGNCPMADLHATQTAKEQKEDEFRKERKQVVETGWAYSGQAGATTAAPVSAQAAAPAPAQAGAPPATPATAATGYYVQCAAEFGERASENCAAAANEYYVYCYSASLPGPVMYFSDVFAFNENVSSGNLSAVLAGPFLEFLEKKYGVKVNSDFYPTSRYTGGSYPTACSQSLTPLSYAQSTKHGTEENVAKSLHEQIVETGWRTSIAPLPPVTAPLAAPNEYYVSCYSDTALSVQYFSEIFAAVPTGDSIRNAFLAFLQKKYGFNDTRPGPHVDCDVSAKPGNAYMFKTAWSVRQNREGLAKVNQKQIIETGWKYAP
jgi:hypothetical protein